MRADRLMSMLLLLDTHRRLTAKDLARRLEVSERTVYRDLDALSAAGIPVYAERGNGGGCRLTDGYRLRLTGLTTAEAQVLSLPGPPRVLADLGLTHTARDAVSKLLRALPAAVRTDAASAHQRILVDAAGWDAPHETVEHLGALQQAVWSQQRIAIGYSRGDGTVVERVVDPLGLVAKGSVWYLVGSVDGSVRVYRAARVQAARLTGEPAQRPSEFDLAAFWAESSAEFKANIPRYTVRVRATPAARAALAQMRRVRIDHDEVSFDTRDEAVATLLGRGAAVEVIEPGDLRQEIAQSAAEVVSLYASAEERTDQTALSSRIS